MDIATPPVASPFDHALRRLLHRWLIQYNPLYLVSAALVLVGVILLSQGIAGGGTVAQLGITAIAELYAWALIGGAALLTRIRLRRPALMLALLAALYQCDLTLHTETCAYLGTAGVLGSAVWLVSFMGKVRVLAWAMKLRISRSAFFVASFGAAMLATMPWLLRVLHGALASSVISLWLFAVFAAGLWSLRRIESQRNEEAWGAMVMRRSLRATWAGWSVMMLVHVGFWLSQHPSLHAASLLPAATLLLTRWIGGESKIWLTTLATVIAMAIIHPQFLWLSAALASAALSLRALRFPCLRPRPPCEKPKAPGDVYRQEQPTEPSPRALIHRPLYFAVADPSAMVRLLSGAAGYLYLAVWTYGYVGGPLPAHLWWLDLIAIAVSVVAAVRLRSTMPLFPPALALGHLVVSWRLIAAPQSALQWGVTCVAIGFGLLLVCLLASVHWRHRLATHLEPSG